jgi:hypothetical protein
VKCPGCQTEFTAGSEASHREDRPPRREEPREDAYREERREEPYREERREERLREERREDDYRDEPPRPSRRPSTEDENEPERRPERRSSRRDDDYDDRDDDYDDRPRRRRRPTAPHRGGSVLGMGIGAIVGSCLCVFLGIGLGIGAINMANNDLREMREGRMDPSGQGQTQAGRICGIIAIILSVIAVIINIGIMANNQ